MIQEQDLTEEPSNPESSSDAALISAGGPVGDIRRLPVRG